jgi:hypothetical protein
MSALNPQGEAPIAIGVLGYRCFAERFFFRTILQDDGGTVMEGAPDTVRPIIPREPSSPTEKMEHGVSGSSLA